MTIKQQGGVFGRNPTFNNVEAEGKLTTLGKFGVGTNTPLYDVDVVSAAPSVVLRDTDAGSGTHWMRSSNNTLIVGADIGNSAANSSIWLQVDAATKLAIGSTGDVTVSTGNLVIGTSGNGIDFSATPGTGTSELFDDYEEGTFTPAWTNLTVGNGTSTGRYTKIGRLVFIEATLVLGSTTSVSVSPAINNIPFASDASFSAFGSALYTDAGSNFTIGFCAVGPSNTVLSPFKYGVSGAETYRVGLSSTSPFTWAVNDIMQFSISYTTAS